MSRPTIHYLCSPCCMGYLLLAQNQGHICALYLGDSTEALIQELSQHYPDHILQHEAALQTDIDNILAGLDTPEQTSALPLALNGTEFQNKVWQALCTIPFGKTASYSDIAQKIGAPKAVRAVASACAANEISILIPCHRVVRKSGALSDYRWGLKRKQQLLQLEAHYKAA